MRRTEVHRIVVSGHLADFAVLPPRPTAMTGDPPTQAWAAGCFGRRKTVMPAMTAKTNTPKDATAKA